MVFFFVSVSVFHYDHLGDYIIGIILTSHICDPFCVEAKLNAAYL